MTRSSVSAWFVLWAAALCVMLGAGMAQAADPPTKKKGGKPKRYRVSGTVSVTKDDEGKITAATITTTKGTLYQVDLQKGKGEALAKTMDGKKVHAVGVITKEEDKRTITVSSFKTWTAPTDKTRKRRKPKTE